MTKKCKKVTNNMHENDKSMNDIKNHAMEDDMNIFKQRKIRVLDSKGQKVIISSSGMI